jgi:hypothetical protein
MAIKLEAEALRLSDLPGKMKHPGLGMVKNATVVYTDTDSGDLRAGLNVRGRIDVEDSEAKIFQYFQDVFSVKLSDPMDITGWFSNTAGAHAYRIVSSGFKGNFFKSTKETVGKTSLFELSLSRIKQAVFLHDSHGSRAHMVARGKLTSPQMKGSFEDAQLDFWQGGWSVHGEFSHPRHVPFSVSAGPREANEKEAEREVLEAKTEKSTENCDGWIFCQELVYNIKEALVGPYKEYWYEDYCSGSTHKTCPDACNLKSKCYGNMPNPAAGKQIKAVAAKHTKGAASEAVLVWVGPLGKGTSRLSGMESSAGQHVRNQLDLEADAIIAIANTPHRLSRRQQAQVGGLKYVQAGETAFTHASVKPGSWLADHTDGVARSAGETFNVQVSLSDKSEAVIQLRMSAEAVTTISDKALKTLGSLQMVGMKVVAKIPPQGTAKGRVFMYGSLQLQGGVLGTITFSPTRIDLRPRGSFHITAFGAASTPAAVVSNSEEQKKAVHHSVWGKNGEDPALAYVSATAPQRVQPFAGQAEMEVQKNASVPLRVGLMVKVKRSANTLVELFKQRFSKMYNDENAKKLQMLFVQCTNSDDSPYITVKADQSHRHPMEMQNKASKVELEYQGISLSTYPTLSAAARTIGFPMDMGNKKVAVQYLAPWSAFSAKLDRASPYLMFSGTPLINALPPVIARLRWHTIQATVTTGASHGKQGTAGLSSPAGLHTTVRGRVDYQVSASVWQHLSLFGTIKDGDVKMKLTTAPKAHRTGGEKNNTPSHASFWPRAFGIQALTLRDMQLQPVFDSTLKDCPGSCGVKGFLIEASATLHGMHTAMKSTFFKDQFFSAYLDSKSPQKASWLRVGPADGYAFPVKGLHGLPPHAIRNFKISVPLDATARVRLFNRALALVHTRPAIHKLNKVLRKLALKPIDGFECLDTTKPLVSQTSTKSRAGKPPKATNITEWSQVKSLRPPTTNAAHQAAEDVVQWPKGCQHKRWMPLRVLALIPQAFDVRTKRKKSFRMKLRTRVLGGHLEAAISMPYSALHEGKSLHGGLKNFAFKLLRKRLHQLAQNLKPAHGLSSAYQIKTQVEKGHRLQISIRPLKKTMKQLDSALKASLHEIALKLCVDTTMGLTGKESGSFEKDFDERLKMLKRDFVSANQKIVKKVHQDVTALKTKLSAGAEPRLSKRLRPDLPKLPTNPATSACAKNDLGSGTGVPLMAESHSAERLASAMELAGWDFEIDKSRTRKSFTSVVPESRVKLLDGLARQSSEGWGGAPRRAVDGNTAQNYHGNSCTHTQNWGKPWWRLQFDAEKEVDKVEVWNRADCCSSRLAGVQVITRGRLGNQLCGTLSLSTAKQTVSCRGASAAMVELRMPRKDYLSLCEVKVYGSNSRKVPPPRYLGCYQDNSHRDLKHGPNKQGYSPATCAVACHKYKGVSYNYFAVQAGGECRCDNDYSTPASSYPRKPDSECNHQRSGYGGGWRNAVYTSNSAPKEQCQPLLSNGYHLSSMQKKMKGSGVLTVAFGNCGYGKVKLLVNGAVQHTVRHKGHAVTLVEFSPGTQILLTAGPRAVIQLKSMQVACVQDVKHLGRPCQKHCHGVSGPCNYCGTEGICCRKGSGDFSAGCNGRLGTDSRKNVCVPKPTCSLAVGKNYRGPHGNEDIRRLRLSSVEACSQECYREPKCQYFVYNKQYCWLKKNYRRSEDCRTCTSGNRCNHKDNALHAYVDKALSLYHRHLYTMYKWSVADKKRVMRQKPLKKEHANRHAISMRVGKVVKDAGRAEKRSRSVLQSVQELHGAPMKDLMKALEARMPRLQSIDVGVVKIPWKLSPDKKSAPDAMPILKVCFTEIGCQSRTAPNLTQLDRTIKALARQALHSWMRRLTKLQKVKVLRATHVEYANRKITPWSLLLHSKKKASHSRCCRVRVPVALKTSSFHVTYATALYKDKLKAFVESDVQHVPAGFVVASSSNAHSEVDINLIGARERKQMTEHMQSTHEMVHTHKKEGMGNIKHHAQD